MEQSRLKRLRHWIFSVLLVVLLVGVALHIVANVAAGLWWGQQVDTWNRSLRGRYTIHSGFPGINLLGRRVSVKQIHLLPAAGTDHTQKTGPVRDSAVALHLPQLELKGFDPLGFFMRRSLSLGTVSLDGARLDIFRSVTRSSRPSGSRDPVLRLPLSLRSIRVGKIILNACRLHIITGNGTPDRVWEISTTLSPGAVDLIESATRGARLRPESLSVSFRNTRLLPPGGWYEIRGNEVSISGERRELWAKGLSLEPRFSPYRFGRRKGHRITRAVLHIDRLRMTPFVWNECLLQRKVHLDTLRLGGVTLIVPGPAAAATEIHPSAALSPGGAPPYAMVAACEAPGDQQRPPGVRRTRAIPPNPRKNHIHRNSRHGSPYHQPSARGRDGACRIRNPLSCHGSDRS